MGKTIRNASLVLIAMFFTLAPVGCASKGEIPTDNLRRAENAIQSARTTDAQAHAPLELRLAEDKLRAAQDAVTREDYETARRMADEALVNAQLAGKKADSEKAKRAAREMHDTIEALRRAVQEP